MRSLPLLTVMMLATVARGAVVQVAPAPGTPLQDAINAAAPGDKLLLAAGSYYEAVVVDKRLKMVAEGQVTIGPEQGAQQSSCAPAFVLDVAADGVRIQGGSGANNDMIIQGGGTAAVRISGRSQVKLRKVGGLTFCPGASALAIEAAARVKILGGGFANYSTSVAGRAPACRVADLTGRLDLRHVVCRANFIPGPATAAGAALIVENVPASLGPLAVNVRAGVYITRGGADPAVVLDGVSAMRMTRVAAYGAPLILGEPAYYAISLDATSSGNTVDHSTLVGPVLDQGSDNCFHDNTDDAGMALPDACG